MDEEANKEAIAALKRILADEDHDAEVRHAMADAVLCSLLRKLGYANVVALWKSVPKWYA